MATSENVGDMSTTVCVVGGGMSGLIAARELRRRGVDVLVVEAADRLGGRALSETTVLGSRVDLGGQWLGRDHHLLKELAAESGVDEFPMHTTLMPTLVDGNRRLRVFSPAVIAAGAALTALSAVVQFVDTQRWNSVAGQTWLDRVPGRATRRILEISAQISWTGDLDEMSVHAMATAIRRQHGLGTMLTTAGGAQDSLLVVGVGTLVDAIGAELGPAVRTGHRVTAIVHDDDHALVTTTRGDIRCARVIVTAPAPLLSRIAFQPALTRTRAALVDNTYMGAVYKAIAVYDRPFWRERDGGELVVLDAPGRAVFDTTPPGGPGHLCILVGGREARQLDSMDLAARQASLLGGLSPFTGPGVLEPVGWHEKSWHLDENVGGGYMVLPRLGTSDGLPPVDCAPFGAIHWAGSETAEVHPGYLDGAIESGLRVADEVVSTL
ncbi:flavin monoamine oxidase family protein [Gordonia sp. NPDC058843]|uniref:flavin monoamine oxidase family protein n=1 Tax=Gordonia sp. NPDC058843 TaxID=3346648 RepID=UPI00367A6055